jgi:hypothetical protein
LRIFKWILNEFDLFRPKRWTYQAPKIANKVWMEIARDKEQLFL